MAKAPHTRRQPSYEKGPAPYSFTVFDEEGTHVGFLTRKMPDPVWRAFAPDGEPYFFPVMWTRSRVGAARGLIFTHDNDRTHAIIADAACTAGEARKH